MVRELKPDFIDMFDIECCSYYNTQGQNKVHGYFVIDCYANKMLFRITTVYIELFLKTKTGITRSCDEFLKKNPNFFRTCAQCTRL